jgi:branched-chain amino acid transport system ATP-binding protein
VIECRNICKSYGPIEVLKGISLTIGQGETFAIIGPNGAGKTTFFRVVTGESPPNSGSVHLEGEDITRLSASARVRRGFGRTFQVARILGGNSVLENLVIAIEARQRNAGNAPSRWRLGPAPEVLAEATILARRIALAGKLESPASTLSHGDRKRLELGMTLALKPRVLLMDEPTAGMSPSDRLAIVAVVKRLRDEEGLTVVLTEHDMDVVADLSDRVMVMNYGEPVAVGTTAEIRADPSVREIYLGEESAHA